MIGSSKNMKKEFMRDLSFWHKHAVAKNCVFFQFCMFDFSFL